MKWINLLDLLYNDPVLVDGGGRGPLNFHYERSLGGLSKAHKHTALSGYDSTWSSAKTVYPDNNLQERVFYRTI